MNVDRPERGARAAIKCSSMLPKAEPGECSTTPLPRTHLSPRLHAALGWFGHDRSDGGAQANRDRQAKWISKRRGRNQGKQVDQFEETLETQLLTPATTLSAMSSKLAKLRVRHCH